MKQVEVNLVGLRAQFERTELGNQQERLAHETSKQKSE
jgi:hypothetical protein